MTGLFGVSTETFGSFLQTDDRDPHIPDNVILKEADENLRPKKPFIKGDPDLPDHYNIREAYPMC